MLWRLLWMLNVHILKHWKFHFCFFNLSNQKRACSAAFVSTFLLTDGRFSQPAVHQKQVKFPLEEELNAWPEETQTEDGKCRKSVLSDWVCWSFWALKHSCSSQKRPGCFPSLPASCDTTLKNLLTAQLVTGLQGRLERPGIGGARTQCEPFQPGSLTWPETWPCGFVQAGRR